MMFTEQQIGDCQLIHGDCLSVLPLLDAVDHIITDPPYEKIMHDSVNGYAGLRTDGVTSTAGSLGFDSIDGIRDKVTPMMKSLCNGWMLLFCTPEGVAAWRDAIEAAEAKYKRACVWVKPDAAPQFNGQGPAMGAEMLVTAWCGKGHSKWNGGGKRGVFTHNTNQPDRDGTHPTEKPLPLMMELVHLFTNPGDTVLDPFMGSATTGLACMKLGRKFIGIEKDDKFYDLACRRISAMPGSGFRNETPEFVLR